MWHTGPVDFGEVYEQFKLPVWRLARRLTGNDEEALDTTQEIFLRVWRGLPGFRGDAKLSTWVFQIAWNYLRAHRRRMGRNLQFISDGINGESDLVSIVRDRQADPERRATSAELLERVDKALDELPEHLRAVVWLRDGEGLSYREIADTLDLPIGTVRSRLARARDALRRIVGI